MCAFPSEEKLRAIAIELRTPVDQFLNDTRRFFNEGTDRFRIAQTGARIERVVLVKLNIVVVTKGRGNPALRIFGRRFAEAVLCDDEHRTSLRQLNRRTKTRDAGADDQVIANNAVVNMRARGQKPIVTQ
jgi:hypothetical protein